MARGVAVGVLSAGQTASGLSPPDPQMASALWGEDTIFRSQGGQHFPRGPAPAPQRHEPSLGPLSSAHVLLPLELQRCTVLRPAGA